MLFYKNKMIHTDTSDDPGLSMDQEIRLCLSMGVPLYAITESLDHRDNLLRLGHRIPDDFHLDHLPFRPYHQPYFN